MCLHVFLGDVCVPYMWMLTLATMPPQSLASAGPARGISGGVPEIAGEHPKFAKVVHREQGQRW